MRFLGYFADNLPEDAGDDDWGLVWNSSRSKWEIESLLEGGFLAASVDLDDVLEKAKTLPQSINVLPVTYQ